MFNTGPLFQLNYGNEADIIVDQGGTDSSKSYTIMQVLCTIACTEQPPDVDPIISVLSESVPNSKKGAWRIMQSLLQNDLFRAHVKHVSEGDRIVYFKLGWVMEFLGATDEQNAKQGKRQYLFVNEANGIPWNIFWQYAKRTRKKTWVDYNPSAPFWAHEKLLSGMPQEKASSVCYDYTLSNDLNATVCRIISDHRHNPFLSANEHAKTEGIKDANLYKVYARGLTGNLLGLIYPNWRRIADADFPWQSDSRFGGLDFGYTNDPTAGVHMVKVANKIYVHELCYHYSFTDSQIKELYKPLGYRSESGPIYCDHDPDRIKALRAKNLYAIPARKKILQGISKVKEFEILYTASSANIDFERQRYMWAQDPTTGKLLNEPIPGNDHLMDAIRYGIYTKFVRKGQ